MPKWYRFAAAHGDDCGAPVRLGVLHARGTGVAQSVSEAVMWFRAAAEGYWIGSLNGLGRDAMRNSPPDRVLAHMWYSLADAQGLASAPDAAVERDRLTTLMTQAELDEAERLANEWKRQGWWGKLENSWPPTVSPGRRT